MGDSTASPLPAPIERMDFGPIGRSMLSEEQPYIIGYCLCNCPIYQIGEEIQYTCSEYPCQSQDKRKGLNEKGKDE